MSEALKTQVGGNHYSSMAIQPAEFIIENRLGFCEGNVVKYVTRYQTKNGVEDLRKARHYLDMLIEKLEDDQPAAKPRNTDTTKATKARVDKMAEHRGVIRSVIKKIIDVEPYKLSNRGIARKLTERGYKTALGKSFNHVQVARILSEDCSEQQRVEL